MTNCNHCEKPIEGLPFKCGFCGNEYCAKHRLPENHECIGLADYKEQVTQGRGFLYKGAGKRFKRSKRKRKTPLTAKDLGGKVRSIRTLTSMLANDWVVIVGIIAIILFFVLFVVARSS